MQTAATTSLEAEEAIVVAGAAIVPLPGGALYWPDERLLAVADLHLEKGSSFARRGVFLPPYDSTATLTSLAGLITRFMPRTVVALGDSFHDRHGHSRLDAVSHGLLAAAQQGRDWIWVSGNHDPTPPQGLGGMAADELCLGPITFRHEPRAAYLCGEIAGHLHPVGKVRGRGRSLRRGCFAASLSRMILPAFGAYAGGLNVLDRAFQPLFRDGFDAWLAGEGAVYRVAPGRLLAD